VRQITHIVMHCTATPATADIGAADVDRWHRDRGWSGIGYHFVIRRNGVVEKGRDLERAGAHVAGFNSRSIGISLAGGVASNGQTPVDNFTDAQMEAARDLVLDLMANHGIGVDKVLGHKEVIAQITHGSPKACPVFSMDRFRRMLEERRLSMPEDLNGENWGTDMHDDDSDDASDTYTVVAGDTLWGIANRHGTTVGAIRQLNPSLTNDVIHPGDVLRV